MLTFGVASDIMTVIIWIGVICFLVIDTRLHWRELTRLLSCFLLMLLLYITWPFLADAVRIAVGSPLLYEAWVQMVIYNLYLAPFLAALLVPLFLFRKPGTAIIFAVIYNLFLPITIPRLIGESFLIFIASYTVIDLYVLLRGRNIFKGIFTPLSWNLPIFEPNKQKAGWPFLLNTTPRTLSIQKPKRIPEQVWRSLEYYPIVVAMVDGLIIVNLQRLSLAFLSAVLGNHELPQLSIIWLQNELPWLIGQSILGALICGLLAVGFIFISASIDMEDPIEAERDARSKVDEFDEFLRLRLSEGSKMTKKMIGEDTHS